MFTLCRQHYPSNSRIRASLAVIIACTLVMIPILSFSPVMRAIASAKGSRVSTLSAIKSDDRAAQTEAQEEYGNLSLQFEANQGQTDPQVKFLTRAGGATVFLTNTAAVFVLTAKEEANPSSSQNIATDLSLGESRDELLPKVKKHSVRMQIEGANPVPQIEGLDQQPGIVNYFIGDDPQKWHANIQTFARVRYRTIYPGVDLEYYGTPGRQLEYDFAVHPGADATQVALSFEGADSLRVDETSGDLLIETPLGQLRQHKAVVYQETEGERYEVESGYELRGGNHVGFRVGSYDRTRPLIIDPVVIYSTYLGGSGDDRAVDVAVDGSRNTYIIGTTQSANFPTAPGAFDITLAGSSDVFVTKLNAAGTTRVYSTYLGGTNADGGNSIAIDQFGFAYLTGQTMSGNFPIVGAVQSTLGGSSDVFVTKLSNTGSSLLFSTYLGGSSSEIGGGIALDPSVNAYVTGLTSSANFPLTSGAFDTTIAGGEEAFVTKLNNIGSSLVYSTYIGGTGGERGASIAVDFAGSAYITGRAVAGFPTTPGAFQTTSGGNIDCYVTKLNPSGSALVYSTFLGGSFGEIGFGIAVDSAGNAYVAGQTASTNFPMANAFQPTRNGASDGFLTKLNATGSALIYSTYLGGSSSSSGTFGDGAFAIAVDSLGNAYVTGQTDSADFPTTAGTFQDALGGGPNDAFVTKLNATGTGLGYSSYLGGNDVEGGLGIAVDSAGNAYVVGGTGSSDFPTVSAIQPSFGAGEGADAFIAKIKIVNYSITGRVVDSSGNGIGSVTVTLSGANSASTKTDASGNFNFGANPEDEYTVAPFKEGLTFSPESVHIFNLDSNRELLFIGTGSAGTAATSFQFGATSFSANEDAGQFQVIVTRSGDTSQAASIDYATIDGTANDRGDYTTAIGRLRFNAGETAKSFNVFITDDVYLEGNETINLTLSNPASGGQVANALLTIVDNDLVNGTNNPIDTTTFFVRQHYIDFLNRAPDGAGQAFWTNNIDSCGANVQCLEVKRIDTSAAFFLSIEFQQTGFLVERMYRAAFNRFPRYREFLRDTQEIGRNVVVGQAAWETQLVANQQQFAADFIARSDFAAIYAGLSNQQYVDALNANTNASLSTAERDALVAGLNAMTETRATVLKKVADDSDFVGREVNPAFVLMEFIGYLRRNPDDLPDLNFDGFSFWLSKLNQFGGDFRKADMVKSFLVATEYRARFGQP